MSTQTLERRCRTAAWALCAWAVLASAIMLTACSGVSQPDINSATSSPAAIRAEAGRLADQYVATSIPGNAGYRIGPQDVLEITVFMAPDLSKSVQVAEAGTINIPLLGAIRAAGKTPAALERDIEARLGVKYMKSPQATVFVKEYNSQRVTIEGAVRKPGVYPIRGDDTLLQVVARAEGLDREAASNNVIVFRNTAEGRQATRYDIGSIHAGGHDPEVRRGDVIVVEDSDAKAAFRVLTRLLPLASPVMLVAGML